MPNFTLSEILTIALVILIVFGPQRLPEIARKTGQAVRKAREMAGELRREFEGEFQDVAQPLKEARDELRGVGQEMGSSLDSLSNDVARAKEEVEAQLAETNDEVQDTSPRPADPPPGGADTDDDSPAEEGGQ